MCEILARLTTGGEFEVISFGDKVILEEPVEAWPLCDVMLSWHSEGFPLRKAQAYVALRRPFLINDVHMQDVLLDRRRVYKTLMDNNIPVPRHILVNRQPPEEKQQPDDELTTSSGSAASSPRAGSPAPQQQQQQQQVSRISHSSSGPLQQQGSASGQALSQQSSYCSSQAGGQQQQQQLQGGASGTMTAASSSARSSMRGSTPGVALPDPPGFIEGEDCVELNGVRIDKPFVEKPVSGEDHNIYIYYPHSMGGGVKRLFRKVDNKSADYDPHHPGTVRRDSSYIYEEFLTTGGTDVKVYTVGPRYAHAEARKSPVVDGKVNRTPDGKEVRFPVLLSPQEKEIARMVCLAFGQRVCGFDLLRSETGRSYVCDVNGWSFVKNSKKYYDDAAGILRSIVLSQLAPHRLAIAPEAPVPLAGLLEEVVAAGSTPGMPSPQHGSTGSFDDDVGSPPAGRGPFSGADAEMDAAVMREVSSLQDLSSLDAGYDEEGGGTDDSSSTSGAADGKPWLELRCVLAVIRHGDRTPKQKMKVTVTQAPLLALFAKHKDSKGKQAKLKSPGQLQELLDIVRQLLADMEARSAAAAAAAKAGMVISEEEQREQELHEEQREKLRIVRTVLEQGGTFSGINRKVQLKPTKWSRPSSSSKDGAAAAAAAAAAADAESPGQPDLAAANGGEVRGRSSSTGGGGGSSGGAGEKASSGSKEKGEKEKGGDEPVVSELLLILKYGGVLTHAGRSQAEDLGKMFRMVMYPRYGPAGGGLLRLHSTYRHDMKIYSSDEGRVQMSAAAFIQGLLDLEGSSLTPILVSLVTKNASMLDAFGKGASDDILATKNTLYQHLTWDPEKASSMCSKLALPLATPASTSPPPSPKRTPAAVAAAGEGPFASEGAQSLPPRHRSLGTLDQQQPSAGLTAAAAGLPTTSSCLDLLTAGRIASAPNRPSKLQPAAAADSSGSSSPAPQQQQQRSSLDGIAPAVLSSIASMSSSSQQQDSSRSFSKLGSMNASGSVAWNVRQAEARAAALSGIRAMPERPLALLYQLVELMKVLVDQLREKCLEERLDLAGPAAAAAAAAAGGGGSSSSAYSSLTTSPDDWRLDEHKPCSGERLLLMFDRWRKLLKSFFSEKKQQFDISKVPDIYDSAKYDAIHNSHLQLTCLKELYGVARTLASVVVPHEYGLDGPGKLLIGSKICAELLGKLLCDLDSMKEESIVTAAIEADTAAARAAAAAERAATGNLSRSARTRATSHAKFLDGRYDAFDAEFGQMSLEDERMRPVRPGSAARSSSFSAASSRAVAAAADRECENAAAGAPDDTAGAAAVALLGKRMGGGSSCSSEATQQQRQQGGDAGGGEQQQDDQQEEEEKETLHRLCPTYASDVNSPLRHVRTRIYFTSESHIHSLVNVLRYCHLPPPPGSTGAAAAASATSRGLSTPTSSISPCPSYNPGCSSVASPTAAAGRTVAADGCAAAAAAVVASVATVGSGGGSVFASAAAAAAAGVAGDGPSGQQQQQQQQPLITPEAEGLLADTSEFDYLTHIVFRMYENKQVPVDSPDRFLVEIQFSNGANYDPTHEPSMLQSAPHTLPTQPRRLLTPVPGVSLHGFQELVRKYARGKNTPSNYQLQVALRAPLSGTNSHAPSKPPTPGASRQASGAMPQPAAAAAAAATALVAVGPGISSSAPLPAAVVAAATKASAAAAAGN
uniref:Inositol hexakisphosphate and diphosphoinositol-pentakisphosphate kinase n=1 Tax=Tetradesmus obliquus TaxID=3088 RepID=A0A383W065_TETOB|eukprot:jgi/Sobl393_1/4971/SZX70871.1